MLPNFIASFLFNDLASLLVALAQVTSVDRDVHEESPKSFVLGQFQFFPQDLTHVLLIAREQLVFDLLSGFSRHFGFNELHLLFV